MRHPCQACHHYAQGYSARTQNQRRTRINILYNGQSASFLLQHTYFSNYEFKISNIFLCCFSFSLKKNLIFLFVLLCSLSLFHSPMFGLHFLKRSDQAQFCCKFSVDFFSSIMFFFSFEILKILNLLNKQLFIFLTLFGIFILDIYWK